MNSQGDLESVIRSARALIFSVSFDGNILCQNEYAAELFTESSKEVQNIKQLVVQQNKQFDDALAKCVASKHPFDPVLVEATLHGCQGDVPLLLSLVRDDSEVLKILGLCLSPLQRKLVEDTKSRLTSLVAQEFRSPLNGMVGLTMALCKSPALSAPIKKQLGMLRSSSSRLLDLVTNVMDVGQGLPQESKVNFAELVEEVFVMTSLAVDRSNSPLVKPGVELHNQLRYMDRLPLVLGNRNKFIHLVYNLVTNACKFTAVGSVTISAKHLAESSELEIIVEDTGCGISESCLPRIFEPFWIDAARPKQVQTFQGAGLGLAVCKEIAELHHGTIMAESKENEGSTFTVRFPCLPEFGAVEDEMTSPFSRSVTVPPQQVQPLVAPRLSTTPPSRTQKKRPVILHVELDAKIQIFFKQSFDEYEILTASGVNNIEEWLQEKDPDIILLDLRTPLVLCHKVCTFFRQLRQPPALLVSVDTPGMLAVQAVDEKLKESALLKPFDVDALKKKFSAVLKEPLKTGEFLEKTLVELMTMKTALLEDQFQNALTSQVQVQLDGTSKRSWKDSKGSGFKPKVQKDTGQQDRSRSLEDSEIERLKEEIALLRARDMRLAGHIRYQSSLNKAVLQEFGAATSSSRFPIEKVNLSELIDAILAKAQAGKVAGLDRFSSPGGIHFHNGLKDLAPIVMGHRSMIEHMIVKLLEQCAMLIGSVREVSIIGKQLPNESLEVTLDWPRDDKENQERPRRQSAVQSFSLRCFTSHALHCEATRQRPLLLAVDDEEAHQSVLRSTLGSEFQVVCHMNGQAALDWLEGQDLPDIILLDAEMKGLTGYEVCKSIREKYGSISDLPVILMYDKPPSAMAALEGFDSGSNDLITKPFDPQLLKEKVSFQLGMDEVNVMQEVQRQKIRFLEMRVSEQASQIGQLRDCQKERSGPNQRSDLQPELERWKLRSMQVAKRLLLQSQSFPAPEVHPFTAVLCYLWSAVSVLFYLFAYYVGGVAPRWSSDLTNIGYHAGSAILLIFSAFVLELGFLWTGLMFAQSGQAELKKTLRGHRLMDSFLTLLEYVIKFVTGITIWQFEGPVHVDIWAVGGERPVFFVRFAQWAVAVPLLILISNRAFLAEYGLRITMMRTLPSLIVTFWSVWLAWLMEVTTVPGLRWPCMFVSAVGLFLPLADQVQLCLQCQGVNLYKLKCAMLIYQIVTFIFYAALFMFGRFGIIELSMEQIVYAYCDSTVKVLQGALLAMIRSCEDAEQIHRWYAEAVAYKKDFDTIIKLAHVPVVTFLQDGTILRLNEAASELFNSTDDKSLVGHKLTDMIRKDKKDLFDQSVQELCEKDKSAGSGLLELTCKSPYREDECYLLVNLVMVDTYQEGVKALVAIGQDLSELCELKSVEEKKNRLMAVVSHEIRSPLHGMIGLAASMMELVTNDGMKRQLGMVKSCAARLLDLVTNVMDLSESEQRKKNAGSKAYAEQKVNFVAITEEAVVMSRMAVDKAGKPLIKAGVELKNCTRDIGKVPLVKGNPYKCTQMIYNLLTNACKFTVSGSVFVCAKHIKEQSILEVSVVDTGCGISPEAQKRIFKPFEQEHSSSGDSRNFQGLGLGLAVVLEIVQMHNASIRVESELGKGSSFIISFACINDEFCEGVEPVPTVPKRRSSKPATLRAVKRKRPLILSVDDCEVNQEIIKSVLAAEYELVCCMDGPSGLDWLEKNRANGGLLPDVILLDIQMPRMTGYDVCKKIRQHYEESHTALPIMMLSANTTKLAAVRSKENGSTDFIAKPFAKDFLKSKIQEVLKMKEATSDFSEQEDMHRQSTEDLSMDVMGAKTTVLEAEKNEMEARAVKAELRAAVAESKLVDMHQLQGHPVSLQEPGPMTLGIDMAQDMTELEFLHNELVQREVTIARLESELGRSRASNQLISRRLQMQNRLNQMLHDTLLEGCEDDSASCRD